MERVRAVMQRLRSRAALLACWIVLLAPAVTVRGQHPAPPYLASKTTTVYGCPKAPAFNDPWVKNNIALTYGLYIQDGLGGQTARTMGIYAIAQALGVGYVHTPLHCIGHIGGYPHWRNRSCDSLPPADTHTMQRISKFVKLPTTTAADVSSWRVVSIPKGSWNLLADAAAGALQQQQPTLIKLEMVNSFLAECPDLFFHVQSWSPDPASQPKADLASSWLLHGTRSRRIVVHQRRGDLNAQQEAKRGLPTSFYLNVAKAVIQIIDSLGQDYTVEWFTEASNSPEEHEDLLRVRREVPNLTVHLNSDLLWNWQQMAAADVFVMSKSAYSLVPAVVNPNAVIIRAPPASHCKVGCNPSNWVITRDPQGTLPQGTIDDIKKKLGA